MLDESPNQINQMDNFLQQQNQRTRVTFLLAALGVSVFLLVASTFPFQGFFGGLFEREETEAQVPSFSETFDGAPTTPQPWNPPNWEVTLAGQAGRITLTDPMDAHHGPNCEPPLVNTTIPFNVTTNPLVTHPISRNADTVFNCRNHIMTAIRGDSYSAVYLTPAVLADFSQGEAVIRFDMSTFRSSSRDWIDITIQPFDTNQQLNFQSSSLPEQALHIEMGDPVGQTTFRATQRPGGMLPENYRQLETMLVPDPARRDTFEIRISRNHLRFCMPGGQPAVNGGREHCWVDSDLRSPLTWDRAVIQFNHRSYNPFKADDPYCFSVLGRCRPGTWHWDNVSISPAVPFTMIKANQEYAEPSSPELTFSAPSPANAHLKFISRTSTVSGQQLQYSIDGGQTWQNAVLQVDAGSFLGDEWFKSYWTPIPAGVTSVRFRRADGQTGSPAWVVRDASFWALSAGTSLPTTPPTSPTSTPTSPTPTGAIGGLPTPTPVPSGAYTQRVDAGGSSSFTDSGGRVWEADQAFTTGGFGFVGGTAFTGDQTAIAGTNDDPLYVTTRFGSSFDYNFTVPNGTYNVTLKLAEVRSASCTTGVRIFNVASEGVQVITNNDTFARVGCATAGDRSFTTSVTDGVLNLAFSGTSASVNGIEVVSTTGIPLPTPTLIPTISPTSTPVPTIAPTSGVQSGSRVSWQGNNWYLMGANVPWYNWACDFGCNANGGVSSITPTLSAGFARLRDAGVHKVRWWVFPGDPWQITRDGSGAPTGLNPAIYADFDAALQLAQQYDLYYDFVLFNAATAPPRSWIDNPDHRARLGQVLGPLFARYRNNPRVMTWEIFNEPEYQIWNGEIGQANVVATGAVIADSVHANSSALVTVGHAMLDGMVMWANVNLDYYSPHWYPGMSGGAWCAICQTVSQVRSRWPAIGNKPIVIGEMYAGSDANPLTTLNTLYNSGYAGSWAWSLFNDRTGDRLAIDLGAVGTFVSQHSDVGPRGSIGGLPTPTAVPTATPTPRPTSTPIPTPIPTNVPPTPTPTVPPFATPTPIPTPVPPQPGGGLSAVYFNNVNFTGTFISRTDPNVNFNWGSGSPHIAIAPNTFSVRWTGQIVASTSGAYTFYVNSDDGVRLWVNNQLIIDQWFDHRVSEFSGVIGLTAGQPVSIRLEYYENKGRAQVELRWSSASTPKQIVPQGALIPD